jgi:hypothetical protein
MALIHRIVCDKCQATLNSKAGVPEGQLIQCPKCKAKFKVADPDVVDGDTEVIDDVVEDKPAPKKASSTAGADAKPKPATAKPAAKKVRDEQDEDDEEDERPRAKKKQVDDDETVEEEMPRPKRKPVVDDDDDDRPKSKKRSRDDDDEDEDERPAKKKKRIRDEDEDDDEDLGTYGKLKKNIWVRVSVLAVLLGTMGVLGYMLYKKNKRESSTDEKLLTDDEHGRPLVRPKEITLPPFPKKDGPNVAPKQNEKKGSFQGAKGILKSVDGDKFTIASVSDPNDLKTYTITAQTKVVIFGGGIGKIEQLTIGLIVNVIINNKGEVVQVEAVGADMIQ